MKSNKEFTEATAQIITAQGLLQLYTEEVDDMLTALERMLPELPKEQGCKVDNLLRRYNAVSITALHAALDALDRAEAEA